MDQALASLSQHVGAALKGKGLILATAESCTGGWVAEVVTATAGSSAWFDRGFITYSNAAKQDMLGVKADTLQQFGAVSEETAREMADGARRHSSADITLSITGIAGPGGGSPGKPVGTVCFAWCLKGEPVIHSQQQLFAGDREAVRRAAVIFALEYLLNLI